MDYDKLLNMTDEELKKAFPERLRERLYRITENEYVAEDIRNWVYDNYPEWEIDDEDVAHAAEKFSETHDCTLPYWNTIEGLIEVYVCNNPRLTQEEIDRVREDLSSAKEDNWDGQAWDAEPEDVSGDEHSRWMEKTWDKFDDLKLADVYPEDEEYTHGIVGYAIDNDYTVGDFYELLGRIEAIIKG